MSESTMIRVMSVNRMNNPVTVKLARLLGYEPLDERGFRYKSFTAIYCAFKPLMESEGYGALMPISFDPYLNANDLLMVQAYIGISVKFMQDYDGHFVYAQCPGFSCTKRMESRSSKYFHTHSMAVREAVMDVTHQWLKHTYKIEPTPADYEKVQTREFTVDSSDPEPESDSNPKEE